jgi:hypothetical protein
MPDCSEDDKDRRQKWVATEGSISAGSSLLSLESSASPPPDLKSRGLRRLWSHLDTPRPGPNNPASPQAKPDVSYDIILQLETRPISQEQLIAEVKGIYAGLVIAEAKCLEVDNKQATLAQADPGSQPRLNNEQWWALIALHRTLLHEHHDFFLASQHPSAPPALRRLASKYAMPARMWRHGIHSFLELLKHRLPASLDHMLTFIYLAYSMMALLYETVPAFEDTWIECLGDLGRYRMAVKDDDIRGREVWAGVARYWYLKASDKSPTTGRLYHHLAILARPNALQQLFYYIKSLCVAIPFISARESVLTFFDPVLNAKNHQGQYRLPPLDTAFVKAHGLLFTNRNMEKFDPTIKEFIDLLDYQIGRVTKKFIEQGYYIAITNCCAILDFGLKENPLIIALFPGSDNEIESRDGIRFQNAWKLSIATINVALERIGDPNILSLLHVVMVFFRFILRRPTARLISARLLLETGFNWGLLINMLNSSLEEKSFPRSVRIENRFPIPEKDDIDDEHDFVRPMTEDWALRGMLWAEDYFPKSWFPENIDPDYKCLEAPWLHLHRIERILWLALEIGETFRDAQIKGVLSYNKYSRQFQREPFEKESAERKRRRGYLDVTK